MVFVVVEHSFAESVVVLQGKKQIDFAAGLPGHFEFGICVEVPSATFGDACRDPESVVIADVAAGDQSIAFVTDDVGVIFEGQGIHSLTSIAQFLVKKSCPIRLIRFQLRDQILSLPFDSCSYCSRASPTAFPCRQIKFPRPIVGL